MGTKKQYSVDIGVNAELQMKNAKVLESEIKKLSKDFDFGAKTNASFDTMLKKIQEISRILEKSSGKTIFSSDEIKTTIKASETLTKEYKKFETVMSSINQKGLKTFSKDFIAATKAAEVEIKKIKESFKQLSGGITLDKANESLKETKKQIKELTQEKKRLETTDYEERYARLLAEQKQKLKENQIEIQKIVKLQEKASQVYQTAYVNQDLTPSQAKKFGDSKNVFDTAAQPKITKSAARETLVAQEYEKQVQQARELIKQIELIDKKKNSIKQKDEAAIILAKKLNLENINGIADLRVKATEVVKSYKEMSTAAKNRLVSEQSIIKFQTDSNNKIKEAVDLTKQWEKTARSEKEAFVQQSGYNNSSQMTKTYNRLTTENSTVTKEDASEQATVETNSLLTGVVSKLEDLLKIATLTEQHNAKVATQSERQADEGDIKTLEADVNSNTNADGTRTREKFIGTAAKVLNPSASKITEPLANYGQQVSMFNEANPFDSINQEIIGHAQAVANIVDRFAEDKDLALFEKGFEKLFGNIDGLIANRIDNIDKEIEKIDKRSVDGKRKSIELLQEKESLVEQRAQKKAYSEEAKSFARSGRVPSAEAKINTVRPEDVERTNEALKQGADNAKFFGNALNEIGNKVQYFVSLNFIIDKTAQLMNKAIAQTRTMDKDLTQIGLVLGKTSGAVWGSFNTYSSMADRLNTTTSEVVGSMKLFYQQGLNTAQVNKMVEASAIAAALGESTLSEASNTLTSIMNSYQLNANKAIDVTDKISQVAIKSAADFGELSTAIEKVASSAATVGLDLDHLMGYLGKMIETTR